MRLWDKYSIVADVELVRGESWNVLGLFIIWIWTTLLPQHQTWKHYYYECCTKREGILLTINCGQIWDYANGYHESRFLQKKRPNTSFTFDLLSKFTLRNY